MEDMCSLFWILHQNTHNGLDNRNYIPVMITFVNTFQKAVKLIFSLPVWTDKEININYLLQPKAECKFGHSDPITFKLFLHEISQRL